MAWDVVSGLFPVVRRHGTMFTDVRLLAPLRGERGFRHADGASDGTCHGVPMRKIASRVPSGCRWKPGTKMGRPGGRWNPGFLPLDENFAILEGAFSELSCVRSTSPAESTAMPVTSRVLPSSHDVRSQPAAERFAERFLRYGESNR
jgi:hypothetical protein